MTKEEIIEMARQAGVRDDEHTFEFSQYKYLERFATLVAEKEREACAKMAENRVLIEASNIEKIAHYTACKNIASGIQARGQE